jgi:carbon-monoxide dehydrogenase large subunit
VRGASDVVLDRARTVAASTLEAAPEDIVVTDDGRLSVAGVPARALSWGEVARLAASDGSPLAAEFDFNPSGATFPFGTHIAVVEVDTETGVVVPVRHVAVDDCGRIINPLLVAGQQHGGIAQGVSQALYEQFVYSEDGTPLTSTLVDYAVPSAAELPSFEVANTETPTSINALGAKGIGESATVGSTPAVQNAVIDALSHLGVRHIDMPCSPERVWKAIRDARSGTPANAWREPPLVFADIASSAPQDVPAADDVDL